MLHNILWTGGWDSTFRILDLVLNKRETVQPYYILDDRRKSTAVEIKTMEKIKDMMKELDPNVKELIYPTIMIEKDQITENDGISKNYQSLLSHSHLGVQYDWLARYAESISMNDLELCIHQDDKAEGFIKDDVELVSENEDTFYRLKTKLSKPELQIFSYYHFPLLTMTKLEMGDIAKASGFSFIMEETWFCFNPQKNGKPCGYCNPCKYTKEEGLGRRVPRVSASVRARLLVATIKQKIKNAVSHSAS